LMKREASNEIYSIDTPALVVDLDKLERNLRRMASRAKEAGVRLRPHIKTHKSPWIALKQLELGASGITVAKIGEAEVMRKHGITDILIAYPIVGAQKLKRLEKLATDTEVTVALDSVEAAQGISEVGQRLGRSIPFYIDVDTGLLRCGREPGEQTLRLAEEIAGLPFIRITGLMTHAGHAYKANSQVEQIRLSRQEGELLVETRTLILDKLGIDIPEISVGSTPTSFHCGEVEGITEIRPGTYVFNDATMISLGLVQAEDCALSIYTTVVSRPSGDRAILDAGSKTLSSDKGAYTEGYGIIKSAPCVRIDRLSEEHGVIVTPQGFPVAIGDRLEIIPNHVCPTVNLADELIGIRNGKMETLIPIEARGKNK
jgi:D-serine deaminase-like pyridoxal phosphate-dependent protein